MSVIYMYVTSYYMYMYISVVLVTPITFSLVIHGYVTDCNVHVLSTCTCTNCSIITCTYFYLFSLLFVDVHVN